MVTPVKTDVFKFMALRAPQSIEQKKLGYFYIQDDYIGPRLDRDIQQTRRLRMIFAYDSSSVLGRILYKKIFCESTGKSPQQVNNEIIQTLLETCNSITLACEDGAGVDFLNGLEKYTYIRRELTFYLLPSKLDSIYVQSFSGEKILAAMKLISEHSQTFNRESLLINLKKVFGVNALMDIVFNGNVFQEPFHNMRVQLFDTLYLLHILRRRTTINLEEIISGLQILHTLEFLAVDDFLHGIYIGEVDPKQPEIQYFLTFLRNIFPELENIDFQSPTSDRFYYIKNSQDLINFVRATPIIPPIVAELAYYGKEKFNSIKPYLGDLKVVKQWLCGYKAGEISHIHNIMKNEEKIRDHRHLEKTEEVFSFSSESSEESHKEQQTTDRFEFKKEAEKVIKTDINIGANANMTYNQGPVFTANIGASFAYANSIQDTQRTAENYAQDILNKAVTNIQSRSSQQRSITKIYETEEKNTHKFTNTQPGSDHISGIYRWLDKKYKAQLYDFGQRWMFEFVIPEPAAFYVTSKLKAAEFDIAIPTRPKRPHYEKVKVLHPTRTTAIGELDELIPSDIDEAIFNKLRIKYDLTEFFYPIESKSVTVVDLTDGSSRLSRSYGAARDGKWTSDQYKFTINEKGYNVTEFSVFGQARFWDQVLEDQSLDFEQNRFQILINGLLTIEPAVIPGFPNAAMVRSLRKDYNRETLNNKVFNAVDGNVIIDLQFQDVDWYEVSLSLFLELDSKFKLDWQTRIYNKIQSIEQKKADKINQELEIGFNSQMADYRNRLDELNAQTVNDILQGRSEAFNSQIIREELKKHCITMIAKEFDYYQADDLLSNKDAVKEVPTDITSEQFWAGEVELKKPDGTPQKDDEGNILIKTVAEFQSSKKNIQFPKIDIAEATTKGKFIQFIEQAFEWQQIAYIFYPYFWGYEGKWVKLMNRLDFTDNNMTAFLKAGSARILIAVTPGYDNAVMHFLATRETWEGGSLPVIGDPLFIPIYEEIRKQQDDLLGGKAEGKTWDFELPTSLVYLQGSSSLIPEDLICHDDET